MWFYVYWTISPVALHVCFEPGFAVERLSLQKDLLVNNLSWEED